MVRQGSHQCPCCDYFTLAEPASYETCAICYWEDDGQGLADLDEVSAPNHITLRQGRVNFARFGAADQAAMSLVLSASEREGVRREVRA
jgi:hypothetical protein